MKAPLLKTKLFRPVASAELVVRPRLLERLTAGISSKLILVSAPAGYGKTTLLSAWAANSGLGTAWLSLDENDNDPERFMVYLSAAIQSIGAFPDLDLLHPELGLLQSFQPVHIEDQLSVLIDQLGLISHPFVLVLDDYHVIKNPEIHKAVTFLIDYQPPQMHLAITTREDPPLPVSRLRVRGQLTELRQVDLRFNLVETAAFLSQWGSVKLAAQDVAVLAGRTEGWVAGLQMAALALQRAQAVPDEYDLDQEAPARMIAAFGGGHEYIVDYFSTEVFAQQPEEVKAFLRQTSVLDQLCGPLCEAVTRQPNGQQMLERLQKANLFVIALDQERRWYRYHHLFCDLLKKQLLQQSPESMPELHRRASRWYEAHEMIDQAFQHAQLAGDQEKIGWIIDEYSEALWLRGDFTNLLHRINALTPEQFGARLEIAVAKSLILASDGDFDEAEKILAYIDRTLALQLTAEDQSDLNLGIDLVRQPGHLLGLAAAARAQIAVLQGNSQVVLPYARQALDILAKYNLPWDIPWKCQILISMSDAYLLAGDIPAAKQALVEAIPLARAYHHDALFLEALTKLAITHWMQGNLYESEQVCQTGLAHISQNNLENMPITAGLWIMWGWIQTERNELQIALDFLLKGHRLSRLSSQPTFEYLANMALLRFWYAKGNLQAAEDFIRPAELLTHKKKIPAWLDTMMTGWKLLLWLKQNRLSEVEHELQARGIHPDGDLGYPDQPLYDALARRYLARGDFSAALKVLDQRFEYLRTSGQTYWLSRVSITRALIFSSQQNRLQALEVLEDAVRLAVRETAVQIFLDEGEPIFSLLKDLVRRQPGALFKARLLQAFANQGLTTPFGRLSSPREIAKVGIRQPALSAENAQGAVHLLEPLTGRELEVLGLIADGLSNQQIASRLYVSVRTVKFHTSHIYCKLDVESRTEAIAKARKLNLIS